MNPFRDPQWNSLASRKAFMVSANSERGFYDRSEKEEQEKRNMNKK